MADLKIITKNRKASHDYFLLEKFEAGIVLFGSEIKSIRNNQASIKEAYVKIENGEAWLIDAHIAQYSQSSYNNHEPKRARKLLLHQKEIDRLAVDVRMKSVTIIPTMLYLKNGLVKVEIAIAKGKKLFDKRADIAKKDAQREIERQFNK